MYWINNIYLNSKMSYYPLVLPDPFRSDTQVYNTLLSTHRKGVKQLFFFPPVTPKLSAIAPVKETEMQRSPLAPNTP